MFILNPKIVNEDKLYRCKKEESTMLLKNGFSLFSIEKGDYIYYKTQELIQFLNLGGE